jgi:hypothetical protein
LLGKGVARTPTIPSPPDYTGVIWWVIAKIATEKYNATHFEKQVLMKEAKPGDRGAFPPNQRQQMAENYLRAQRRLPDNQGGGHFEFGALSVGFSNLVRNWPEDFPNYDPTRANAFEGTGPIVR